MLEEVGSPYRTEVLEYGTTMKAADYLAINRLGKVPAIRHGTAVVTEAAVLNRVMGFDVPADQRATAGYGAFGEMMDVAEQAVTSSEYIAGETFSAADVYCGSQIGWGLQFGTIEKRPAFVDYWGRISNREAWRRAQELDDALGTGA
jgi:glutathione S-transferase